MINVQVEWKMMWRDEWVREEKTFKAISFVKEIYDLWDVISLLFVGDLATMKICEIEKFLSSEQIAMIRRSFIWSHIR